MKLRTAAVTFCLMTFLSGCAAQSSEYSYRESSFGGLFGKAAHLSRRNWVVSEKASILVAPLPLSRLTSVERHRLQRTLVSELGRGFRQVDAVDTSATLANYLVAARQGGYHYLLVPFITGSIEGLTGLPELLDEPSPSRVNPDAVTVKLALYSAPTGGLLDVSLVEIQSARFTLENHHSLSLASSAFELYAKRLNAVPHP